MSVRSLNGEAYAHEMPGVRLLVLEHAATAIPGAAVDEVVLAVPGTAFLPDARGMLRLSVSTLDESGLRGLVWRLESASATVARTG